MKGLALEMMQKIAEALHMRGHQEEEQHHKGGNRNCWLGNINLQIAGYHLQAGDRNCNKSQHCGGEHKEGLVDKIKDKIHGEGGHDDKGEKKKEKEKKKHEHGHEDHGDDSSSSDSD